MLAGESVRRLLPGDRLVKVATYHGKGLDALINYNSNLDVKDILKSSEEAAAAAQDQADAARNIRDKWIKAWDRVAGALDPKGDRSPYTPPPYRNLRNE